MADVKQNGIPVRAIAADAVRADHLGFMRGIEPPEHMSPC